MKQLDETTNTKEVNLTPLSQEEVIEIIKMGQQIYNTQGFGYFTPFLANQNQISLNNNGVKPAQHHLDSALSHYKERGDILQAYREFMSTYDMLFDRLGKYYSGMLAFDMDRVCINAYTAKDYNSKEYKDDLLRVRRFFDSFDYKEWFGNIARCLPKYEVYFTWLRDNKGTFSKTGLIDINEDYSNWSKYMLQTLPQDKCIITGAWENRFLFDFNMDYFLQAGITLDSFDPVFKEYWRDLFDTDEYNPTAQFKNRNGSFAMITQTSPEDGAWCWKFDITNTNTTPFLAPMIKSILTNEEVSRLQRDKNFLSARAIIVGSIPLLDKQVGGETTDAMAWKPATLTKFMSLVKQGLDKNISNVATPTVDPRFMQFQEYNDNMYKNQIKAGIGQGASASRLLFADDKMSESEIKNAIRTDYNIVKPLYNQFSNFLNYYVNQKTKKYKFKFTLSGCTYDFIRKEENEQLLKLAEVGMVLNAPAYSKIVNMTPDDFERALEESKYGDFTSKLGQLVSIHTQSKNDTQGRPKKEENDISDSGSASRDYD